MAQDKRNLNVKKSNKAPDNPDRKKASSADEDELVSELSVEVTDAVRSAVSRVMAEKQAEPTVPLPDLDLSELSSPAPSADKPKTNFAKWMLGTFVVSAIFAAAAYWAIENGNLQLRPLLEEKQLKSEPAVSPEPARPKAKNTFESKPVEKATKQTTSNDLPPTTLVATAETHMRAGRIKTARNLLREIAEAGSAEAAFAMAKSYDANHLATIENSDEQPDAVQAEYWYRLWHKRAVAEGLVSETVNIDRLIRSLVPPKSR